MLSREEQAEVESIGIRLDELASSAERELESREECASEHWSESAAADAWREYVEALREAAIALERAELEVDRAHEAETHWSGEEQC